VANETNVPGTSGKAGLPKRVKAPVARPQSIPALVASAAEVPAPMMQDIPVTATEPVASLTETIASKPAEPATLTATVEGNDTMATIAQPAQVTEKAQAMFGEMNTRFKTAFEKSTKIGEEMTELAKGNVEALVSSARIAAKGGETIGQDVAEYSKKSFENAMAVFKSFASVKSPTELFQLQSDFAKSSFDSAVAEASKLSESLLKIAGEVAQPLSSRYALAAEKIKATTAL
jgi:phasin family protein